VLQTLEFVWKRLRKQENRGSERMVGYSEAILRYHSTESSAIR